jgi:hypothetical protein
MILGVAWFGGRLSVCDVLLPASVLLRRDAVDVVGAALLAAAGGLGHRKAAGLMGWPVSTARLAIADYPVGCAGRA